MINGCTSRRKLDPGFLKDDGKLVTTTFQERCRKTIRARFLTVGAIQNDIRNLMTLDTDTTLAEIGIPLVKQILAMRRGRCHSSLSVYNSFTARGIPCLSRLRLQCHFMLSVSSEPLSWIRQNIRSGRGFNENSVRLHPTTFSGGKSPKKGEGGGEKEGKHPQKGEESTQKREGEKSTPEGKGRKAPQKGGEAPPKGRGSTPKREGKHPQKGGGERLHTPSTDTVDLELAPGCGTCQAPLPML